MNWLMDRLNCAVQCCWSQQLDTPCVYSHFGAFCSTVQLNSSKKKNPDHYLLAIQGEITHIKTCVASVHFKCWIWGKNFKKKKAEKFQWTLRHKYLPSLSIKKFQSRGRGTLAYSHWISPAYIRHSVFKSVPESLLWTTPHNEHNNVPECLPSARRGEKIHRCTCCV